MVNLHIVFGTKYRSPLIPCAYESKLHSYIAAVCREMGSNVLKVGGVEDHVHIVCSLPRTVSIAKLVEEAKKNSSKWMKRSFSDCKSFSWQNGYGAFSVSQSVLEKVVKYVERQREHHTMEAFKKEFEKLLKAHNIDYDERYLWN